MQGTSLLYQIQPLAAKMPHNVLWSKLYVRLKYGWTLIRQSGYLGTRRRNQEVLSVY